MELPENILYHSMRSSIITNQPIFTSNPFSVHFDVDFERDENGIIKKDVLDKLNEDIYDFPSEAFSKLATLFYEKEKLQRASLIFIQSHIASLEIKIPNYYVSIEAITGYISEEVASGKKSLSPIKDKKLASELIKQIIDMVTKFKMEKALDNNEFNFDIILKNINKLNAPPNADKLAESFTYIAYTLSKEQREILKNRNSFLHGSFLKTIGDDTDFRLGLHTALRLQFMIAVLILKLTGFSGKIINYAELWSHITEMKLGEGRLVKI
jgi:hypothetical protein